MPYHLLNQLGRRQLPAFISDPQQIELVQRLLRAGYVDGRLHPATSEARQFIQVDSITPLGERVRTIFAHAGVRSDVDSWRAATPPSRPLHLWSSSEV
jgi:hypothetical protein